jgi:hypothetical protein
MEVSEKSRQQISRLRNLAIGIEGGLGLTAFGSVILILWPSLRETFPRPQLWYWFGLLLACIVFDRCLWAARQLRKWGVIGSIGMALIFSVASWGNNLGCLVIWAIIAIYLMVLARAVWSQLT